MPLRAFFITHTPTGGKPLKQHADFPDGTSKESAERQIYEKFGRRDLSAITVTQPFAEIISIQTVSGNAERGQIEGWRADDQSLLTAEQLRQTVSYAPGYTPKRKAKTT